MALLDHRSSFDLSMSRHDRQAYAVGALKGKLESIHKDDVEEFRNCKINLLEI